MNCRFFVDLRLRLTGGAEAACGVKVESSSAELSAKIRQNITGSFYRFDAVNLPPNRNSSPVATLQRVFVASAFLWSLFPSTQSPPLFRFLPRSIVGRVFIFVVVSLFGLCFVNDFKIDVAGAGSCLSCGKQ